MANKGYMTITIFGKRYQKKDGTGSYVRFTYHVPNTNKYYDIARTNTCNAELPKNGGFYSLTFIGSSAKSKAKGKNPVIWLKSIRTIQAIQKDFEDSGLSDEIVNEEVQDDDVPF